ncbi:MAG TPA: NADH-quinone oxidoreductase subunit I [Opitutae bacterium]|nr:NADH-quinone oxidoreductase subunit I [Opitutae bacterium]|tara:strand:+ start:131 stop:505 length:375 start_codon:yes stop_codon:yes gene_type:complete
MEVSNFAPILVQIIFAALLAGVIIVASHFFGQRSRKSSIKDSAYECGIKSEGKTSTRFSVKFYVTAMLFILFDIEVLFLIPWALIYRDFLAESLPILGPILFFLAVLVIGLVYEIKKGGLEWEK